MIHAFNQQGLICLEQKSNRPQRLRTLLDDTPAWRPCENRCIKAPEPQGYGGEVFGEPDRAREMDYAVYRW